MTIHHVSSDNDGDYDAAITIVRADCGALATIVDGGETSPPDFDFVIQDDPQSLTDCWRCLSRMSLATRERAEAVP